MTTASATTASTTSAAMIVMTLRIALAPSIDFQPNKGHERGRIGAIGDIQSFRHDVATCQSADAELHMLGQTEIEDVAERELCRCQHRSGSHMPQKLVLIDPLGAPKYRVRVRQDDRAV